MTRNGIAFAPSKLAARTLATGLILLPTPRATDGDRGGRGGLADGLAGLPVEPCWSGDPVAWFEERFAQPSLLGMDDGLPRGLHRLGPCGNAIVPQISELIGRAILASLDAPPATPLATGEAA